MSTARRDAFIAVGVLALIAGVAWYLFDYNSASGRCSRGDLGACIVLSAQQAEQSASAAAEQSANDAAANAQASASAAVSASVAAASASVAAEQQAAHQAAILQLEQSTCAKVGGKWTGGGLPFCGIDYRSPADGQTYHYTVSFDNDGNVTPLSNGPQNAQQCAAYYGAGLTGYWHAETDVCAV